MIVLFRTRRTDGVENAEHYFTGGFTDIGSPRTTKYPDRAFGFPDRRSAYDYADHANFCFNSWRVGER